MRLKAKNFIDDLLYLRKHNEEVSEQTSYLADSYLILANKITRLKQLNKSTFIKYLVFLQSNDSSQPRIDINELKLKTSLYN